MDVSSFLVCMADFLSILVASAKPSPQDLRTTDKTTSIFFHDVSDPRYLPDVFFLNNDTFRDWSHVYYKRYIRSSTFESLAVN